MNRINTVQPSSVSKGNAKPHVGSSAFELDPQIEHISTLKPLRNTSVEMLNKIVKQVNKTYAKD